MPRRPRPAPREKPGKEIFVADVASSSKVKLPLPKAASKQKLKAVDSEPESDGEKWDDEGGPSSGSGEEDDEEGDSGDGSSGGDSDVDVDAPRVAQWVDDEDLEEQEIPSGDAAHRKAVNAEDIVRVAPMSPKFG
jgi:ribosomal RNA-processing protein 36